MVYSRLLTGMHPMKLLSVNVGSRRTQIKGSEIETTGIYKTPVSEPVDISMLGIPGDFICDQKDHGGPDQAVYMYGSLDYDWWAQELGRSLAPGTFGENLTVEDLESARLHIGDRLRVGTALLEVTAPRIPCSTLAARMRDLKFAKKYRDAERPGLYCRVLEAGTVRAGDEVTHVAGEGERVSALEMFRFHYQREKDEPTLRRILRAPISIRARKDLESDLRRLLASEQSEGRQ